MELESAAHPRPPLSGKPSAHHRPRTLHPPSFFETRSGKRSGAHSLHGPPHPPGTPTNDMRGEGSGQGLAWDEISLLRQENQQLRLVDKSQIIIIFVFIIIAIHVICVCFALFVLMFVVRFSILFPLGSSKQIIGLWLTPTVPFSTLLNRIFEMRK